ncbi:MAG: phosphodiester glycosidase family protein [Clostridiales bacterium]|nr:phosphodiester glycosidase family protein [Candidatus Apopatocola equi]MCQ2438859.1 phosphodiester glycosidase family protein [Oscillospiraceae bacterium]
MTNARKWNSPLRRLGRFFTVVLVTLLLVVILLLGLIYVLERGPSPTVTELFCRSMKETSALKWVPNLFLSEKELSFLEVSAEDIALGDAQESVNLNLIHIASPAEGKEEGGAEPAEETPYLQLIEIKGSTYKGKLLIVRDPKSVIVGTSDNLGKAAGLQLTDMVAKYDGIAGINGGGFNDENGRGNGGIPTGLVIQDGKIVYGNPNTNYSSVVGLDGDGRLLLGRYSGQGALDAGIRYAVNFNMEGAIDGALVINGQIQTQNLDSGINPRTAIGQRADGSLLLLVLDGRQVGTLGATLEDVCDVMLAYGALNVGNLDGGSSSVMVYEGEIINSCASVTGPRYIPDGFIVLKEGSHE